MFVLASLSQVWGQTEEMCPSITYPPLGIIARIARLAFNEMNEIRNRDVNFEWL